MRRLALLPLLLLAACGGAAGNGTDRAFVDEMVPHHQGALDMAEVALQRGESVFVKDLARDIARTQQAEVETLRGLQRDLEDVEPGSLPGGHSMMDMAGDTAALRRAEPFDEAFLAMMVPHHEDAIVMARAVLERGENREVRDLAQAIVAGQEREIAAMRAQLARR